MRSRTSSNFSVSTLDLLGGDIDSGVDHVDVRLFTRLYHVGGLKPRMKIGAVIGHGLFHQLARLDVFRVGTFPSGDVHPVIECARMPTYFGGNDTEPGGCENPIVVAPCQGTRVRLVPNLFDAMIQFANSWIFRRENIEHTHAATGPYNAGHFAQYFRRV